MKRVLIDPAAHEFTLGYFLNSLQLFVRRNCVAFTFVLDCFEFQQTQIFTFFPISGNREKGRFWNA